MLLVIVVADMFLIKNYISEESAVTSDGNIELAYFMVMVQKKLRYLVKFAKMKVKDR